MKDRTKQTSKRNWKAGLEETIQNTKKKKTGRARKEWKGNQKKFQNYVTKKLKNKK